MRKVNSTNAINEKALKQLCNASKTLSLFSGRWKISILFQLYEKKSFYSDFKLLMPEISDRSLSKQLKELQQDGLIEKDKSKTSSLYSLTPEGQKLESILRLLSERLEEN